MAALAITAESLLSGRRHREFNMSTRSKNIQRVSSGGSSLYCVPPGFSGVDPTGKSPQHSLVFIPAGSVAGDPEALSGSKDSSKRALVIMPTNPLKGAVLE